MILAQCQFCRHLLSANPPECAAFPGGIPQEIFRGYKDHTEPVEGDNGIQFEQDPNKTSYEEMLSE